MQDFQHKRVINPKFIGVLLTNESKQEVPQWKITAHSNILPKIQTQRLNQCVMSFQVSKTSDWQNTMQLCKFQVLKSLIQ